MVSINKRKDFSFLFRDHSFLFGYCDLVLKLKVDVYHLFEEMLGYHLFVYVIFCLVLG
jgi:hypothetical protein